MIKNLILKSRNLKRLDISFSMWGLYNKNITELEVSGNPIKISGFNDPNYRNKAPELNANRNSILKEFNIENT